MAASQHNQHSIVKVNYHSTAREHNQIVCQRFNISIWQFNHLTIVNFNLHTHTVVTSAKFDLSYGQNVSLHKVWELP